MPRNEEKDGGASVSVMKRENMMKNSGGLLIKRVMMKKRWGTVMK